MSSEVLADQAVSLLRKLFTDDLDDRAARAATAVAELVEDGLLEAAQEDRLREFRADPADDESLADLAEALRARLDRDRFYRDAVAREVDKALRIAKTAGPPKAGPVRDANGNVVHDVPDASDDGESFFDGPAVVVLAWVVKAAVVIGLVYGGVQVYSSVMATIAAGGIDEDTRCSTFLAASGAMQLEAVKQLMVEEELYGRAADPFLGVEAAFACGQKPNSTLGQVLGL